MATEQQTTVTKAELEESLETNFNDMKGYVDTAVATLTEEMDRQFKEVRGDIAKLDAKVDKRFDEVIQSIKSLETLIKEHTHG